MPPEAESGHNEPPPEGTAGADAHFEQATGNGQVTDPSGPPVGSMPGFVEASTTQTVGNPVPVVAHPAQPLSMSGAYAHAPMAGEMPGVRSRLPDPSELYALPRMPCLCVGHLTAAAGWMVPVPITAVVRTTITTTITSTVATSAAQARLVYTSLTGPVMTRKASHPQYTMGILRSRILDKGLGVKVG